MANNKILLVDDSLDHHELLNQLYGSEGYDLICASNGQEALELLRSSANLPAFILLDLMMPVMDGYGFCEEQKKDARLAHIPIVVMTADGNIVSKTKKLGADAFVYKPANVDDLLRVAKRFCRTVEP